MVYGVGDELDEAGLEAGLGEGADAAGGGEAAEFVGVVGEVVGFGGGAEVAEADEGAGSLCRRACAPARALMRLRAMRIALLRVRLKGSSGSGSRASINAPVWSG